MKTKGLLILLLVSMLTVTSVMAAPVTYTANSGTPVIDGKISAGEWEDASPLLIDASYAGQSAEDLSLEYKVKYDKEYLYILEVRQDSKLVYPFDEDELTSLWMGDSTLFWMMPGDSNGKFANSTDVWFSANSASNGGPILGIRKNDDFGSLTIYKDGKIASSVDGNKSITEVAFKWTDIPETSNKIVPGSKFKFCIAIPQIKDNGSEQKYQINWELSAEETAEKPYAIMTLGEKTEASASKNNAAASESNPRTSDAGFIGYVMLAVVSTGAMLVKSRKNQ